VFPAIIGYSYRQETEKIQLRTPNRQNAPRDHPSRLAESACSCSTHIDPIHCLPFTAFSLTQGIRLHVNFTQASQRLSSNDDLAVVDLVLSDFWNHDLVRRPTGQLQSARQRDRSNWFSIGCALDCMALFAASHQVATTQYCCCRCDRIRRRSGPTTIGICSRSRSLHTACFDDLCPLDEAIVANAICVLR